jgi:multidrug efflux pump subunit AcrB
LTVTASIAVSALVSLTLAPMLCARVCGPNPPYRIILEILPELQSSLESLDRLYVKSPLTGAAVPLSAVVDTDSYRIGPLSINHQRQFPAATLSFNLRAGVALEDAVDAITGALRNLSPSGLPHPTPL